MTATVCSWLAAFVSLAALLLALAGGPTWQVLAIAVVSILLRVHAMSLEDRDRGRPAR